MAPFSASFVRPTSALAVLLGVTIAVGIVFAASTDKSKTRKPTRSKTPADSSVQVTYSARNDMADNAGRVQAGELLKIIDIVAGIASRRHAESPAVTISLDQVIFLKPVFAGDLVHVSAAVNRSWSTSMEVGVRVVKEDAEGRRSYVSHAYMTFVAVIRDSDSMAQPPAAVRIAGQLTRPSGRPEGLVTAFSAVLSFIVTPMSLVLGHPQGRKKPHLPTLTPRTLLEKKRHLLAGRRREKRLADSRAGHTSEGVAKEVKRMLREEVLTWAKAAGEASLEGHNPKPITREEGEDNDLVARPMARRRGSRFPPLPSPTTSISMFGHVTTNAPTGARQELEIRALELDLIVSAYLSADPAVRIEGEDVVAEMPGDEPLRHKLSIVLAEVERQRKEAKQAEDAGKGGEGNESHGMARLRKRLKAVDSELGLAASQPNRSPEPTTVTGQKYLSSPPKPFPLQVPSPSTSIPIQETLATTLHLVFPQDANTVSVLFGGKLMEEMEKAALLAARNVARVTWATVSMDGLEFPEAVRIGEVMTFRAVVLRTWATSCEVYVLAHAEDSSGLSPRPTNDALFVLAAADLETQDVRAASETIKPFSGVLRKVTVPPGNAAEAYVEKAEERRQNRLQLREMLLRIYGETGE